MPIINQNSFIHNWSSTAIGHFVSSILASYFVTTFKVNLDCASYFKAGVGRNKHFDENPFTSFFLLPGITPPRPSHKMYQTYTCISGLEAVYPSLLLNPNSCQPMIKVFSNAGILCRYLYVFIFCSLSYSLLASLK